MRTATTILLLLATLPAASAHAEPTVPDEALVASNPDVRRAEAALALARAEVMRLTPTWPNPALTFEGAVAPGQTAENLVGIAVEQELPLWNARGPAIASARARQRAKQAELEAARATALIAIRAGRARLGLAHDALASVRALEALARELAAAVATLADKGALTDKDKLTSALELARATLVRAEAEATVRAVESELCRQMGSATCNVAPAATDGSQPELADEAAFVARALEQRRDLVAREEDARAAVLALHTVEREVKVRPTVQLGVTREQSAIDFPGGRVIDDDWVVHASLTVPFPLFSGGAGLVAGARAAKVQAALERELAEREITAQVRAAYARAVAALEGVRAFSGLDVRIDAIVAELNKAFHNGAASLSTTLVERDRLVRGRHDALVAMRAWIDAREALELAIGGPLQ